jgi:hypothetical protein
MCGSFHTSPSGAGKSSRIRANGRRMMSVGVKAKKMAERQQFLNTVPVDPELKKILEQTKTAPVTEEELREQRISFAYGNASQDSEGRITKDSIKFASEHIKLLP